MVSFVIGESGDAGLPIIENRAFQAVVVIAVKPHKYGLQLRLQHSGWEATVQQRHVNMCVCWSEQFAVSCIFCEVLFVSIMVGRTFGNTSPSSIA